MVPKQIRETCRPVDPSLAYCIATDDGSVITVPFKRSMNPTKDSDVERVERQTLRSSFVSSFANCLGGAMRVTKLFSTALDLTLVKGSRFYEYS